MGRKLIVRSEAEKRKVKTESRKRHQRDLRRAMAVSHYLLLTATEQHRQATTFVEKLEQKYPDKRDVRKTPEYQNWQQKQLLKRPTTGNEQLPATTGNYQQPPATTGT